MRDGEFEDWELFPEIDPPRLVVTGPLADRDDDDYLSEEADDA